MGRIILDLASTLRALATRGITRLMVEGGPTIAAALVKKNLIDAAVLFCSSNESGTTELMRLKDCR